MAAPREHARVDGLRAVRWPGDETLESIVAGLRRDPACRSAYEPVSDWNTYTIASPPITIAVAQPMILNTGPLT